jgi:hypothetical protein
VNNDENEFLELEADLKAWEDAIASRDEGALERLRQQAELDGQLQRLSQELLLSQAIDAWKEQTPTAPETSESWGDKVWERLHREKATVSRRSRRMAYSIVSSLAACLCLVMLVIVWQNLQSNQVSVVENKAETPISPPVNANTDGEDLSSLLVEAGESWSSLMNETKTSVTGSGAILKDAVGGGLTAPELRLDGMVPASFRKLFDEPKTTAEPSLWQELMGS